MKENRPRAQKPARRRPGSAHARASRLWSPAGRLLQWAQWWQLCRRGRSQVERLAAPCGACGRQQVHYGLRRGIGQLVAVPVLGVPGLARSEEHTSELQSRGHLVCRLLLEKKKSNVSRRRTQ